jgi:hypothetical protein
LRRSNKQTTWEGLVDAEGQLLERLKAGDEAAFAKLMESY